MSDVRVISFTDHGRMHWSKPANYGFAAGDHVVPIGLGELPKAVLSLPIGFVRTDDGYQLAAILGLADQQNLLVARNGQWLADYVPVLYRHYPFKIGKNPAGQVVLCADHDSGLINEGPGGQPFFDEDRKPTPEASAILTQLMQYETDRLRAAKACKVLSEMDMIEPWQVQMQRGEQLQRVEGLYRVNEARLNELGPQALADIRDCGGLMICYLQLVSMHHLHQLFNAEKRAQWANKSRQNADNIAVPNIVDDNGILSFANL